MDFREDFAACLLALAVGLAPPPDMGPVEWGRRHFVVPDGERVGQLWDPRLTPYVFEPLECMRPDDPVTEVSVMKSGQSGFSTAMLVLAGYWIDVAPDRIMLIQPTIQAARDFNRDKLGPALTGSPRLAAKVRNRTKDGDGSSASYKSFPGGSLALVGANSAADLSARTARYSLRDEMDRWPAFLQGQGDPESLADARQLSYTRSALHKRFRASTPSTVQASRIWRHVKAGDQRRWFMPCPHCGTEITFTFDRLRFEERPPYRARYEPECCGADIQSWQQRDMVLAGRWKPTVDEPGRHRSYIQSGLISLLTSWDVVAEEYWKSRGNPASEQGFQNLMLGEPYEEEGADVDVAKVVAAAENYERGTVPLRCGRTALVVDTQDDRYEWALHGFGPSETGSRVDSWLIDAGVIEHRPDSDDARRELAGLVDRRWPYAGGKAFAADIVGIDTGGHHTKEVYDFVRGKRHVRGLKGVREGLPLSTPSRKEVKDRFGRLLYKVSLFLVGTHDLKRWLARSLADLAEGKVQAGGLHLCQAIADEPYVRQLAGERLVPHEKRDGSVELVWTRIPHQPNEALDLAVYARALALGTFPNGLGLDRVTGEAWTRLLAERHGLDPNQSDLFAASAPPANPAAAPDQAAEPAAAPPSSPAAAPPAKRPSLADLARISIRSGS